MFGDSISYTDFTTDAANAVFANMRGTMNWDDDISFAATLRVLLSSRIPKDAVFSSYISDCHIIEDIATGDPNVILKEFYSASAQYLVQPDGLLIFNCNFKEDRAQRLMEILEKGFTTSYPRFKRIEKVTDFYAKQFKVLCFADTKERQTIIVVDEITLKQLHYLQVAIPAFLPWYFEGDNAPTQQEIDFLYSLKETTPDKYNSFLAEFAKHYDFRSSFIKKSLGNFETYEEKREIKDIKHQIQVCNDKIKQHSEIIAKAYADVRKLQAQVLGFELKVRENNQESELAEYFLCNKKLHLESCDYGRVTFCVKDYLTYFDPEIAERVIHNNQSYVYKHASSNKYITSYDMTRLMTEIFLSECPRLKIRFRAAFVLDLKRGLLPCRKYGFPNSFAQYLSNPHINEFECMGNYAISICELIKTRNYIGVVEQCVASCKSLNFSDTPVMEVFMRFMWSLDRFIELPDGRVVNSKEAVEWLKSNQAEEIQ